MKDKYNITIERKIETFLLQVSLGIQHKRTLHYSIAHQKVYQLNRSKSEKPSWENAKQYILYYKNVDMYSLYLETPTKKKKTGKLKINGKVWGGF